MVHWKISPWNVQVPCQTLGVRYLMFKTPNPGTKNSKNLNSAVVVGFGLWHSDDLQSLSFPWCDVRCLPWVSNELWPGAGVFKKEVCPCYRPVSGIQIIPRWITNQAASLMIKKNHLNLGNPWCSQAFLGGCSSYVFHEYTSTCSPVANLYDAIDVYI